MHPQPNARKHLRDATLPISIRRFFRHCRQTARANCQTTWPFWKELEFEAETAIDAFAKLQHPPKKDCPHLDRVMNSARSIFRMVQANLKELTEAANRVSDTDLQKMHAFLENAKQTASEILLRLPKVHGLDPSNAEIFSSITRLAESKVNEGVSILREIQIRSKANIDRAGALTARSRESVPLDVANSVKTGLVLGASLELRERASFYFFPG